MIRKSPLPRRQAPIKRSPIKRSKKPLPKVNLERQAKRRQRYKVKLSAYRRSETYKLVEARSCGFCEARIHLHTGEVALDCRSLLIPQNQQWTRCRATRLDGAKLTHHHKTYARFGGAERPDDIIVLCDRHNAEAESQHPTRNRNYRKSA